MLLLFVYKLKINLIQVWVMAHLESIYLLNALEPVGLSLALLSPKEPRSQK